MADVSDRTDSFQPHRTMEDLMLGNNALTMLSKIVKKAAAKGLPCRYAKAQIKGENYLFPGAAVSLYANKDDRLPLAAFRLDSVQKSVEKEYEGKISTPEGWANLQPREAMRILSGIASNLGVKHRWVTMSMSFGTLGVDIWVNRPVFNAEKNYWEYKENDIHSPVGFFELDACGMKLATYPSDCSDLIFSVP